MATKKKSKKRSPKKKRTLRKKAPAAKTVKRPKHLPKKKSAPQSTNKKKSSGQKKAGDKVRRSSTRSFAAEGPGSRSGEQSGDLQGLSRSAAADSESVEELLEEGNAFEADAVLGVEDAGADEKEVRTHEVPEDDVPAEYLDEE